MPVPVYGAAPPVALTLIVVVPPLHKIVPGKALTDNPVGALTITGILAEQPLLSVIVY